MHIFLDIERLSSQVKERRGTKTLRETAQEIGEIRIATLSRIKQGKIPDLTTFLLLCNWLGVHPAEFFVGELQHKNHHEIKPTTLEMIELLLINDALLDKETTSVLFNLFKTAYTVFTRPTHSLIDVHLRSDHQLSSETADAIVHVLRAAYQAALNGTLST